MKSAFTRESLSQAYQKTWSDPERLRGVLGKTATAPAMPAALVKWLARLALLNGVPFNYLVPDEGMLPPESIRFFHLDWNWILALIEGALSIGRDLCAQPQTSQMTLHQAVQPALLAQVKASLAADRAAAFGSTAPTSGGEHSISGFILRSKVVLHTANIGVHAADSAGNALPLLRWERLGLTSDTMLCLVGGDLAHVDIHEPAQVLHYGIDCYNDNCEVNSQPVTAAKNLYTFGLQSTTANGITNNAVVMSTTATPTDISACFRAEGRVLDMTALASAILAANQAATPPSGTQSPTSIDSAEMGFEMTEGVGMVSFIKQPA